MFYIKIYCIISSLPAIYPIYKIVKKKNINLFDLLIVFHTLNFCIAPLLSKETELENIIYSINVETSTRLFLYYTSFILLLLISSIYWSKAKSKSIDLINLTILISIVIGKIRVSKKLIFILFVLSIIDLVYFMPKIGILFIIQSDENINNQSYIYSSLIKVLFSLHTILFSLAVFLLFRLKKRNLRTPLFLLITLLIFGIISFFIGRRYILSFALLIAFSHYSVNRNSIKLFDYLKYGIILIIFYFVLFPFFNIVRNERLFDNSKPISTVFKTIYFGVNNFSSSYHIASARTEERSVFLFGYLYDVINLNPYPQNGMITVASIDNAIPRVLNPEKGAGSDPLLTAISKKYTDISNSYLLHAYADFNLSGSFFCYLMFIFVIGCYQLGFNLTKNFSNHYSIALVFCISLFFFTYNIEAKFEDVLANLFQMPISLSIVWFILKVSDLKLILKG